MINLKRKTLRSDNNFINFSFLGLNILLSFMYVFKLNFYMDLGDSCLLINGSVFGLLPIYYFYKQFSSKGKYINILPISMKKAYLITLIDWLIIYLISSFIPLIFMPIRFYIPNFEIINLLTILINQTLSFLKVNFIVISIIIMIKLYNKNYLIILIGAMGFIKIIDLIGSQSCFIQKEGSITLPNVWNGQIHLIENSITFILATILFFFMFNKIDRLSVE